MVGWSPSPPCSLPSRLRSTSSLALPNTPPLSQAKALNPSLIRIYMVSFLWKTPAFAYIDSWHSSSSIYPGWDFWRAEINRGQGELFSSLLSSSHLHSLSPRHPISMGRGRWAVRWFDNKGHIHRFSSPLVIPLPISSLICPSPVI